jgi:hypothetical protein
MLLYCCNHFVANQLSLEVRRPAHFSRPALRSISTAYSLHSTKRILVLISFKPLNQPHMAGLAAARWLARAKAAPWASAHVQWARCYSTELPDSLLPVVGAAAPPPCRTTMPSPLALVRYHTA